MPVSSPGPTQRPRPARWLSAGNDITQQFLSLGGRPDIISLAGGLPAAELYPVAEIAEASASALARWGAVALEYGPVEGLPALRDAIAARISAAAGRSFGRENVLLTTGAMQGLDLLGKALIDPGDLIVAQFPTYLGALDAWRPRQPRYERLDWSLPPGSEAMLAQAKFVYAVPNYSNPTGVLVPLAPRAAPAGRGHGGRNLAGRGRPLSAAAARRRGPALASSPSMAPATPPGPMTGR